MSKRVAVIIPFYNGQAYIKKCVDSLEIDRKDVWLIDNSEIPFNNNLGVHHVVTQGKRLGFGKAVNLGVSKLPKGKYSHIIILNQDAYFKENHFVNFVEKLVGNQEDFLCPKLYQEDFQEIIPFVKERYFRKGVPKGDTYISDYVGVLIACSLELWNKLNGFDERFFMYFEENDLFKRAIKDKPILFLPDVHVAHRNKADKMEEDLLKAFYKSEILFAKKHEPKSRYFFLRFKNLMRRIKKAY